MRVIGSDGSQLGVLLLSEALGKADLEGLDLVEISAASDPPVCKIIDYGKYRYQITKKEKEGKKSQHQVKVKEIKVKPNTDEHDLQTKVKHGREFLSKGNKVRLTCVFRGREMMHPEFGQKIVRKMLEGMADLGSAEAPPKMLGKSLSVVIAPGVKKKA